MSLRFGINSMGEAFHGDDIALGSIDRRALEAELGREPTGADVDAAFDRQAKAVLKPDEYTLYSKWVSVVNQFGPDDLFRFYASILTNGETYLHLSTEFLHVIEDEAYWQRVEDFAAAVGATVTTMIEIENRGVSWPTADPTNKTYEPNYGKVERQVSVDVNVLDFTMDQIFETYLVMLAIILGEDLNLGWVSVI